jgi:hypothetical protein
MDNLIIYCKNTNLIGGGDQTIFNPLLLPPLITPFPTLQEYKKLTDTSFCFQKRFSPTRKSPNRATSSDSLLKIDEEKEIGSSKKSGVTVNRSKSMPKDFEHNRLASWLRRKYKRKP